jgi:hypothetical protein
MLNLRSVVRLAIFASLAILSLRNFQELQRYCSSEMHTLKEAEYHPPHHESHQQDRWITYQQFVENDLPPSHPYSSGAPKEEEWLIGDDVLTTDTRIPKKLFKVNILGHGNLQAVFEHNSYDLDMSVLADRGIVSLQQAHRSWPELNPGYDIRYFDLHACRMYLQLHFHPIFLRAFDCIEAYAGKTNLFRYLVVYREGGWYSDWKQLCLQDRLLDTLSAGNTTWFSARNGRDNGVTDLKCHQNAFFGATPRHVVLASAISRVLQNVQAKYYGRNVLSTTGVCVLGAAVVENKFGRDMVNTAKIGVAKFSREPEKNVFTYHNRTFLQHKCNGCGLKPDYIDGNNYWEKHRKHEYYCPDAATLFGVL